MPLAKACRAPPTRRAICASRSAKRSGLALVHRGPSKPVVEPDDTGELDALGPADRLGGVPSLFVGGSAVVFSHEYRSFGSDVVPRLFQRAP
jgi:hypothetical protein